MLQWIRRKADFGVHSLDILTIHSCRKNLFLLLMDLMITIDDVPASPPCHDSEKGQGGLDPEEEQSGLKLVASKVSTTTWLAIRVCPRLCELAFRGQI